MNNLKEDRYQMEDNVTLILTRLPDGKCRISIYDDDAESLVPGMCRTYLNEEAANKVLDKCDILYKK